MAASIEEQVETIFYGTDFGDVGVQEAMREAFAVRLREASQEGRPLRVYAGYDPSRPDIHLGHSITLRKLRQFQDFGHHVVFLIGTFTAQVGDTSDKATGRPRKSEAEVHEAARTYAEQCFKILDRDRTEIAYNSDWLAPLTLADVVELAAQFTVQQFLARDNYKRRIENGDPVGLHEFMYALLQGYDAVHLRCDAQLGATDQLFNIMAGRKLQEAFGQKGSICITYPILVGTDGVKRMSKSTGNTIGLSEPPDEQYGKAMSISDETMLQWIRLITRWEPGAIDACRRQLEAGELHPMELKKRLAWEIVSQYHGDAAADAARERFETVHQRSEVPEDIPEVRLGQPTTILDLLVAEGLAASKNKARQLVTGRGVRFEGEVVEDFHHPVDRPGLLQVGKRHFRRVVSGQEPAR